MKKYIITIITVIAMILSYIIIRTIDNKHTDEQNNNTEKTPIIRYEEILYDSPEKYIQEFYDFNNYIVGTIKNITFNENDEIFIEITSENGKEYVIKYYKHNGGVVFIGNGDIFFSTAEINDNDEGSRILAFVDDNGSQYLEAKFLKKVYDNNQDINAIVEFYKLYSESILKNFEAINKYDVVTPEQACSKLISTFYNDNGFYRNKDYGRYGTIEYTNDKYKITCHTICYNYWYDMNIEIYENIKAEITEIFVFEYDENAEQTPYLYFPFIIYDIDKRESLASGIMYTDGSIEWYGGINEPPIL